MVAGKRQARISEALVALCLEKPGVVGCAVDQHGPFEMDQRLGRVATVQLEHAELDQGFCPIGREIDGLDEALLRLVQLAGLDAETPESMTASTLGGSASARAFNSRMPSMGLAPRTFSTAASHGIHRDGLLERRGNLLNGEAGRLPRDDLPHQNGHHDT